MNKSLVSVIIPVYNGETFLAEAVESIKRQAYQLLEIIIVDDGSTDATARIASNTKGDVRYVYQPNSGSPSVYDAIRCVTACVMTCVTVEV